MDTKPEIISNMPALLESSVSSRNNCLAFCQSTQTLMVGKLTQMLFQTQVGMKESVEVFRAKLRAAYSIMGYAVALGKAAV